MFWWCVGDVLVMFRWCVGDILVMFWWCSGDVLVMFWWCSGDVWWCYGDVLAMFWWCFVDVHFLGWTCFLTTTRFPWVPVECRGNKYENTICLIGNTRSHGNLLDQNSRGEKICPSHITGVLQTKIWKIRKHWKIQNWRKKKEQTCWTRIYEVN